MAAVNRKSYIGKAAPEDLLCHGLKCSMRDRCKRYNFEPNKEQGWIDPDPIYVGGGVIVCTDFDDMEEKECPN